MAFKAQRGPGGSGLHTAGIYADMTVDGPEIGTLVMVIDRAKNLPNRRTMGKQDPYCAARLGKEAKKTQTDKRGGQTPRWDQELRFTVHDSPDYNNLKISVFNDDKKTDLIGETVIGLEEILLPGGGQGDQWHSLSCKGRYAGEIRIELTYYDSRPKSEKSRDKGRKQNPTETARGEQPSPMAGARPPPTVKRRPLPSDPTESSSPHPYSSDSAPVPVSGPRNYQTPPIQDLPDQDYTGRSQSQSYHDDLRRTSQNSTSLGNVRSHSGLSRPLPSLHSHSPSPAEPSNLLQDREFPEEVYHESGDFYNVQHEEHEFDNYGMPVTDDPYALEAVHSQDYLTDYDHSQAIQPRNHRVLELSGSPAPRSSPSIPLPHAHSAPSLGANEHYLEMDNDFHEAPQEWVQHDYAARSSPTPNHRFPDSPQSIQSYAVNPYNTRRPQGLLEDHPPPLPPAHRNSAPSMPGFIGRPNSAQAHNPHPRPSHVPRPLNELYTDPTPDMNHGDHRDKPHESNDQTYYAQQFHQTSPYSTGNLHHRYRSTDGLASQYHDTREQPQHHYSDEYQRSSPAGPHPLLQRRSLGPSTNRIDYNQYQPHPQEQQRQRLTNYGNSSPPGHPQNPSRFMYDNGNQRPTRITPLGKPQAISPNPGQSSGSFQSHYITPQRASPDPAQPSAQAKVPYSPDSFAVFNPQHSNPSTPNVGVMVNTQRETGPMYNSQTPKTPQNQVPPTNTAVTEAAPIIGTNGKVKDPTDHLPPSSYAPEPERKGTRPSIVVNQRNRFGPREARTTPVTTRQQHSAPTTPTTTRGHGAGPTAQPSPRLVQQQSGTGAGPPVPAQDSPLNSHLVSTGVSAQYGQQRYAAHGLGYDRVEVFAPPVPAKIPLDGRYAVAHDSMGTGTLGRDMAGLNLDGATDSMEYIYGGRGGATRPRRSRFGA